MNRKLTAKIQKLNPPQQERTLTFSKCLAIEPETRKLILQKGTVYAVYDVSSDAEIDVNLISNVIHDVLHDSYFQSESISPTQSLEKTIVEIKNKITEISQPQTIQFNILATVLWGNVLYTVQFGSGKSYLMREGEIRPINTAAEGNFSAASGVVKDDDVVVLATATFDNTYPPQKLLSSAISEKDLEPKQSALLMKFHVDETFSENEVVDFGLKDTSKQKKVKAQELVEKIKDRVVKREALTRVDPKLAKKVFLSVLALVFVIKGVSVIKNRTPKSTYVADEQAQLLGADTKEEDVWETEKETDEKNKVVRLNPEAFYDIKIADETANPTEIEVIDGKIAVAEKESGKLFISDMGTPKFEKTGVEFPGIKFLTNTDGVLSFSDTEGYKFFDVEKSAIIETYEKETLGVTTTYSDFIYEISGDILTRYTKGDPFEGTLWSQNEDFKNATSIAISYSIYITKENGEVARYTTGKKDTFEIEGLDKPFGKGTKIVTYPNLTNIYILDGANKRIVVSDENGVLLSQYKTEEEDTWDGLKDLAISQDEKYMYILKDSKVYIVGLRLEEKEEIETETGE